MVRALLAPHVEHVGSRLARGPDARGGDDSAPRLRNPLGPMDRAPLLRVSKSAFLGG